MATQICPKCNSDSFTWHIDEKNSLLTVWECICGYEAYEDESKEKKCENCNNRTKSYMKDAKKKYWWCSSCNQIKEI